MFGSFLGDLALTDAPGYCEITLLEIAKKQPRILHCVQDDSGIAG
jgi:hypothetical protein